MKSLSHDTNTYKNTGGRMFPVNMQRVIHPESMEFCKTRDIMSCGVRRYVRASIPQTTPGTTSSVT